jgi:hypothetical protein
VATWLGRYRLLSRLGAGTVGEVFRAKIFGVEGFEKVLAVKRLLPELAAHAAVVEAFAEAAQAELCLSHANVVQVLDVGRTDEPGPPSFYLTTELVPGVDLATLLASLRARRRDVPLGLVAFVGTEVAKALDHAHRRRDDQGRPLGLVHGGLGPANVLLSWEGEVKVADFGVWRALAVAPSSPVVDAARARRAAYESPERAAGAAPTSRADLYALGVILREMLACAAPSTRRGVEPPATDAPDALAEVVARLLAPSADDRPKDAGTVHDELLGYAYASGERFGAADLAALLAELGAEPATTLPADALLDDADDAPADEPTTSLAEAAVVVLAGAASEETKKAVEALGGPVVAASASELATVVPSGAPAMRAVRAALAHVGPRVPAERAAGIALGPLPLGPDGLPEMGPALDALLATSRALAKTGPGHVVATTRAAAACGPELRTDEASSDEAAKAEARVVVAARAASAHEDRFVGRGRELAKLGAALADATAGHARVVTITGARGIGKTRLLDEVVRRLEHRDHDIGVVRATCGDSAPFEAALALLRAVAGLAPDEPIDAGSEAETRLRALGLAKEEAASVLAALGTRSALAPAPTIGDAFARVVRGLCVDRPHLFAWDGAQTLDEATARAIAGLCAGHDHAPALVLLAGGPEPHAAFASCAGHVALRLEPLDVDETARLVAARLGAHVVPSEVLDAFRSRAGGHPRHLEALARELTYTGAVTVHDGVAELRTTR